MKNKKPAKIIRYLNTGIFPATILFSMGFNYDEIIKHTKKHGEWGMALRDDKVLVDSGSWLGLKRVIENVKTGEERTHYYIILPKGFDFSDYDYIRLAHEVLHICQFMLPDILNRNKEIEAEAYLHSHIMSQCLKEIRAAYK